MWADGRRGCASARRQATHDSSRRSHGCHLVSSGQGLHRTELWAALGWAFWLDPGSWHQPPPQHPAPRQALCRGLLCSHLGLSWAPVCTAWEMGTGTLVSSFLSLGHRSAGNPSVFSQSFCPPVSRSEVWPGSRGQKWPQVEGD